MSPIEPIRPIVPHTERIAPVERSHRLRQEDERDREGRREPPSRDGPDEDDDDERPPPQLIDVLG
jgi:hypothetical protein